MPLPGFGKCVIGVGAQSQIYLIPDRLLCQYRSNNDKKATDPVFFQIKRNGALTIGYRVENRSTASFGTLCHGPFPGSVRQTFRVKPASGVRNRTLCVSAPDN
jgi:hypothetical protein